MAEIAGRSYLPRVYTVPSRTDIHAFLVNAVAQSGGQVLYASPPDRAPTYLGVQTAGGERLGMLVYPFRMTRRTIKNRPADEVRGQLRYGGEASWAQDHHVAFDVAGVDITLMLGVHLGGDVPPSRRSRTNSSRPDPSR